jgi:hypothetical protein
MIIHQVYNDVFFLKKHVSIRRKISWNPEFANTFIHVFFFLLFTFRRVRADVF